MFEARAMKSVTKRLSKSPQVSPLNEVGSRQAFRQGVSSTRAVIDEIGRPALKCGKPKI